MAERERERGWLRESGDPGRVKHSWVQTQGQSHETEEGGGSIDWQRIKSGQSRQESDHAVFKHPQWGGLWQFYYGRWVEEHVGYVCERHVSHLQGHAEQDSCILCTFAVILEGRKWANECLCVSFQMSLVMQLAVHSFLYILSSLFAKLQNRFISFLQMQIFSLILQAMCVWEMAL